MLIGALQVIAEIEPTATQFRRAVGLLLVLVLTLVLFGLLLVALNRAGMRRFRGEKPQKRVARSGSRSKVDAWSEAGRRVALDDGPDVPREPPEQPGPTRGFHE